MSEPAETPRATPAPHPPRRWAAWLLAGVVLAAGAFEIHNYDIELHARTGEWIVEHGEVPATNVLSSIHRDHPTVQDKWLFQVAAHLLLDRLGPDACIAARLALMAALFALMTSTARRLGAGEGAWLLFAVLALVAGRSRFMFRPDLVSTVLVVLVVHVLVARRPDGRRTWPLLLVQLLWVNAHGYFIIGPLAVLGMAAGHLLRGRAGWPVARRLGLLVLAMAAVCLLNPAGLDGALHPVAILRDLWANKAFYSASIAEFRSAFEDHARRPYDQLAFFAFGALSALLLAALAVRELLVRRGAVRRRPAPAAPAAPDGNDAAHAVHAEHPEPERDEATYAAHTAHAAHAAHAVHAVPAAGGAAPGGDDARGLHPAVWVLPALVLLLGFGRMTFDLRRNVAPFVFVVAPFAAAAGTRLLGAYVRGLVVPAALAVLVALGEVTDAISVHDGILRRSGFGMSRLAYPDRGIAFIAEHLPDAGVFTAFRYGSTFTGRRWPEQVAATDGNTHGYPTSWLREVMAASSGADPIAFDQLTEPHGLDVALVPMAEPLSLALLRRDDWTLVALGLREAVYVRRAAVDPGWLDAHDLERRLLHGPPPDLVDTPPRGTFLGLPKAWVPIGEIDQTWLLMAAGRDEAAYARACTAVERAPRDPDALGLCGLLAARVGRLGEARGLLERSVGRGVGDELGDRVRERLAEL